MLDTLTPDGHEAESTTESTHTRRRGDADAVSPVGVEVLPPPFRPRLEINGITVLIVDGTRFHRDLIKSALATQQVYTFYEASTITDAKLSLPAAGDIDLIILENDLEGESGLEFTKRVRFGETTFDPAIPMVMVSAVTNETTVIEARNVGIHEFVSKPFDIGTLVEHARRPFAFPRKFIRAPNYVGPDRRWERSVKKKDLENLAQDAAPSDSKGDVLDGDDTFIAAVDDAELTMDKYAQGSSGKSKNEKARKGLDRFKPMF